MDKEAIHERMLSNISDEYEKIDGSFMFDATKPAAIELEKYYDKLEIIKGKLSLANLEGDELEQRVYELTALTRKEATFANGYVEVTGNVGAIVYKGDRFSSDTILYIATEEKQIDETGKVDVHVQCEVSGSVGNVPAKAITKIPVSLDNINSVVNNERFTNGYDEESDASLLERYYEKIRTPATSNNKYHFRNWAKEVEGVGDVRVIPLWAGDNTVKVVIIDSNMEPASDELIQKVQDHIDPDSAGLGEGKSSLGSFCTVVSATVKQINLSFNLTVLDNYDKNTVIETIKDTLTSYLKSVAFKTSVISYARLGSIILNCEGVVDYTDFLLNENDENISVETEEIAVLGGVAVD